MNLISNPPKGILSKAGSSIEVYDDRIKTLQQLKAPTPDNLLDLNRLKMNKQGCYEDIGMKKGYIDQEQGLLDQTNKLYYNMAEVRDLVDYNVKHLSDKADFAEKKRKSMLAARKRLPEKEAKEKVVGYLNEFDLADRVHAYPAELSGGQRQRTAILQQVLCSETFLLMDEPFSGLDPIAKAKAQALITRVANLNDKNTIIIVSHDIASTTMVSDHLWCLGRERDADGRIVPGASIVQTYNLIDRDLAWHPEIDKQPEFTAFMHEVSDRFEQL